MNRQKFLTEEIARSEEKLKDLRSKLETEKRARTPEEVTEMKALSDSIKDMRSEIEELLEEQEESKKRADAALEANKIARAAAGGVVSNESKEEKSHKEKYSMRSAFETLIQGKALEGREKELHEEAQKEVRGYGSIQGVGVPSFMLEKRTDLDQATSAIQPTVVGAYVDALREAAIYEKVGATVLNGLTADYKIPVVTAQSLAWATAENSAAADGGSNFAKDTLAPIRLTGFADVSNRIMLQNGEGAFQAVMRDFGRETGNKISDALFSTADVTNAPPAIAATTGVGTFTEATYTANVSILSDMIEAEVTLADAEGLQGSLAYVCATNLLNDLKKSAQVASIIPAMSNQVRGEANVNGYPTYFTTSATVSAGVSGDFIFGDFSKVYIGFFGGLDMVRDPYSSLLNDQTRIVIHRHVDSSLVQGAAFVKATALIA